MAFKIEVDQNDCIGCGACVATDEANYVMDGEVAKPIHEKIEEIGMAQEACDGCPVDCIKVTKTE